MSNFQCILCGIVIADVWARGGGVRGCTEYTPRHSGPRIDSTQHLMHFPIVFNIIHPIWQTSSLFSAETQPPLCDCVSVESRAAAVSEDAQNIPQDLPVLGWILSDI